MSAFIKIFIAYIIEARSFIWIILELPILGPLVTCAQILVPIEPKLQYVPRIHDLDNR